MQILYLLREMRSNGEEEGRLALFLLASLPLQNQSLEVEFLFCLEIGNTFKSPSVFQFTLIFFLFECSVCIVLLLGTVQLNFIFLSFILVFFAITN